MRAQAALAAGTADPNTYRFGWGTGPTGWREGESTDGRPMQIVLDPTIWNHIVISANHHHKPPVVEFYNQGELVASGSYTLPAVQCPPGTTLEIGDGWAINDSRRWNGEYKKFALYTEPKSAEDVAALFAAFQAAGGPTGDGGHH